MNDVHPLRVVIKGVLLFVIANLAFAYFNPSVGKLTIYNWLIPGRLRFPFILPQFNSDMFSIDLYNDFDSIFASDAIGNGPKPQNEYRVVILGDSSVWGVDLPTSQILSEQINSLNLQTCSGMNVRAYDLGVPQMYLLKDFMILDKARAYKPDLVIWMVTLNSFSYSTRFAKIFLVPHSIRALELLQKYRISEDTRPLHPFGFKYRTIVYQRKALKLDILLQLSGLIWAATGEDHYTTSHIQVDDNVDASNNFGLINNKTLQLDSKALMLEVLKDGQQLAGDASYLVVNEPIFIATGQNGDIRYDTYYPRWAYDQYRSILGNYVLQNQINYVDLWNAIPGSGFTSSPLHLSAPAENLLARDLAPQILKTACGK